MRLRTWTLATVVLALAACGGGGDGSSPAAGGASGAGGAPGGGGIQGSSHVAVTASAPLASVPSGSAVSLDVVVTNSGSQAASHVVTALQLGNGLDVLSVTCAALAGAVCPADPMALSVPSLAAGAGLHFQVMVAVAPGSRGNIASTVSVSADNEVPRPDTSAQAVVGAYTADLIVSGSGPGATVASGGTAVYTMTIANGGPDAASNVNVENIVDSHQTLASITCSAAGGALCPTTLGPTMTIPTLPNSGSVTFTVAAKVGSNSIGVVSNTLYAGSAGDPLLANNVATAAAETAVDASPGAPSFIVLRSDPGDFIGQGASYGYNKANAVLNVVATGGQLAVSIAANETWYANFALPSAYAALQPGTYTNLTRFPFNNAATGGLDWSGDGRGCNTSASQLTIDAVSYVGGVLAAIDLRFEQHCEGAVPALRGQLHWTASDTTQPAGPIDPPPAALWRAAAGATPATGNYVYLQSDAGDYIGAGSTATYTQANSVLSVGSNGAGNLHVGVAGNQGWFADFQAMTGLAQLRPGYYGDLRRFPFHNPALGGLDWSGDGRGCNTLTGWFVVDSITYAGGAIASVDLRFEQHCEGAPAALRGQVHWIAGDPTLPPGPQSPPPAGLWAPPAGATPATGNYIYLASDAGDYIGQGLVATYTPGNAAVSVVGSGGHLTIGVNGVAGWNADFVGMNSIAQLQPGYYGGLQRYPFHNAALGGMSWYGQGRGCNVLTGWFVVDSVSYAGGALASIDLRFEQHCEGGGPALRGKVHWIN